MLKVGIAGARGISSLMGFRASPDVEITAICDLDENVMDKISAEYNIPHKYRLFEDMLMSDVDAVVIATPMQCHVPEALIALEAGKHVLSEVTAGVTMDELWWLIEAVEKSKKVYMMAEEFCYMPNVQLVKNMVDRGMFGELYYGEGQYLHELKKLATSFNSMGEGRDGKLTWRNYWQLGKRGTFYPTHSIGPMMYLFGGNERISEICTFGSGRHIDLRFRNDDTNVTMCKLASGKLISIRQDCISPRPHNMSYFQIQGTKGVFESPRGLGDVDKVWLNDMDKDTDSAKWRPLSDFNDLRSDRYKNATSEQLQMCHSGGDFFIIEDFIKAITEGAKIPIDVYKACEWTAVALLSELSIQNHNRIMEMPNFRKNMPFEEQIIKL